jgi:hypothetical protein
MYLYQLTLQRSSAICCAVHGNFSSPKEQEIVVSHGELACRFRRIFLIIQGRV